MIKLNIIMYISLIIIICIISNLIVKNNIIMALNSKVLISTIIFSIKIFFGIITINLVIFIIIAKYRNKIVTILSYVLIIALIYMSYRLQDITLIKYLIPAVHLYADKVYINIYESIISSSIFYVIVLTFLYSRYIKITKNIDISGDIKHD